MKPSLFNPLLPQYQADPYPFLRRLREEEPVHWNEALGVWVLTRYADVAWALRDERFSASARHWSQYERFYLRREQDRASPLTRMYDNWMLQADPPRHTRLRGLVSKAFTPRRIEAMRERIARIVHELMDRVRTPGRMDVVRDIAYPLPIIVICEMLGISGEDHERVKHWCEVMVQSLSPALSVRFLDRANSTLAEFRGFFEDLCQRRRGTARDDLLGALLTARDQEDRLDEQELFATCILLAFAGHASTVQGLANLAANLIEHPDQLELIRRQPELMERAVEESLRYESPLQVIYRTTAEPVEIGSVKLDAGRMVFLSLPAANRDPRRFADPDKFDIRRPDNRHLAFGYGIHFCAGAALARLEMRTAMEVILRRAGNMRLAGPAPREPSLLLRGLTSLPVAYDPIAR